MIELCLFRHGRTLWNAEGKYQGHADVDLDDLGRAQAELIAERCRGLQPTAVYASDLRRCADVGARIAQETNLDLMTEELLRERDVGTWSGLTRDVISKRYPEDFKAWFDGDRNVRPGDGESATEVISRVEAFVALLKSNGNDGLVVAVTHSGWIRAAMEWALQDHLLRKRVGLPKPASLTVLRLHDDGAVLEVFNDCGHLTSADIIKQTPDAI